MKLGEIAAKLGCQLEGDANIDIAGVAGIEEAKPGDLTFLDNRKYYSLAKTTKASAILIAPDGPDVPAAKLRTANPYLDFARALELFHEPQKYAPGIHPTSAVASTAKIAAGAHVGPYCFIDENVQIGRNAVLHSFVSIYRDVKIGDDFLAHSHVAIREGCLIGNRVLLQNGVVVGSDGFGFAREASGRWHKILQVGRVVIDDDVEIQAHSAVDRGAIGDTSVGRGTKIDNLVQVGHACTVGEDTILCGQVGLAGTTHIGNKCILAGQSASAGHLTIHDGAILTAQSAVNSDIPAGAIYSGSPGFDNKDWRRSVAVFNRLPDLQREVRQLREEIAKLRGSAD